MATQSNLIVAADHNFLVYEGDTVEVPMTFVDDDTEAAIPFTGAAVKMQIKQKLNSPIVKYTFSTDTADIVISGADDNILTISGWERLTKGTYYYDMQVTIGSDVATYLKGTITVTKDVTE